MELQSRLFESNKNLQDKIVELHESNKRIKKLEEQLLE
jgi:hypothetical protein